MSFTYIEAISAGFPGVHCHATGDTYEDIVHDAGIPVPDKVTLDQWIVANASIVSNWIVTVLAFRNRFTKTEKVAIEMASIDNPTASMPTRLLAASLRVDTKDSASASYIDLARADTVSGVTAMEQYGLIGAGRANEILTWPVQDTERPKSHIYE